MGYRVLKNLKHFLPQAGRQGVGHHRHPFPLKVSTDKTFKPGSVVQLDPSEGQRGSIGIIQGGPAIVAEQLIFSQDGFHVCPDAFNFNFVKSIFDPSQHRP